jgi:hypothetical protein
MTLVPDRAKAEDFSLSETADTLKRPTYSYRLSGWMTRSEVPLTGVPTSLVRNDVSPDVEIEIVPGSSPLPHYVGQIAITHSAEYSLIGIRNIADFEISRGRQIRVWPAPGAKEKDIEIFLFGWAWAALCHQHGLLPLHASAVQDSKGCIAAFAGHCGAGKSTIAGLLALSDYPLVADDILPIGFDQNAQPGAWPYLRRLKLQNDSIGQLALTPTEPVSETLDKEKHFVLPNSAAEDSWRRLERVYLLESDPSSTSIVIEQVRGVEAVHALIDYTYHFQFILRSGRLRDHLATCTKLASKIDVYRLRRPGSFQTASRLGERVCEHLESNGAQLSDV